MIRILISIIFIGGFLQGLNAQNFQAEYLEAKRLFNNQEFKLAKGAFKTLTIETPKNKFAAFSSFYFGLSAYKSEAYDEAKDMWLQLLTKYPDFKQKDEVYLWLASAYFEKNDFLRANSYLGKIRNKPLKDKGQDLKAVYLSKLDISDLLDVYNDHGKDELIGNIILDQLLLKDSLYAYESKALAIIHDLNYKEEDYFALDYKNELKDSYNVAVLLPFGFDSLEAADRVASNRVVMDIYEGLKFAVEQLAGEGLPINLFPYDTKGNQSGPTKSILSNDEMKGMDLIIGPLFVRPFRLVHAFSKENKINMISPRTTNVMAMGDNPFSFLYNVGDRTQAIKLAEYANKAFSNKNAFVFYEQRDSLLAATYKNELEKYEFEVPVFERLKMDSLKEQAQSLKSFYELPLRSKYLEDSLSSLRHVSIETKRVNGAVVTYAEILKILPDSVGHIFVTSKSRLAASNFITTIIERPDTIEIIGQGSWLTIEAIPYSQFEENKVNFVMPSLITPGQGEYENLRKDFISQYKSLPSEGHFTGYDLMYTFGTLMHKNGKYFQEGFRKGQFVKSKISQGFQYNKERDNQVLPVVKIIDSQLKNVNQSENEY